MTDPTPTTDDEMQERRTADAEYRAHMQQHVDGLLEQMAVIKSKVAGLELSMAHNTELTGTIRDEARHSRDESRLARQEAQAARESLDDLHDKVSKQVAITEPFFAALGSMNLGDTKAAAAFVKSFMEGVRTVGRTGDVLRKVFRVLIYAVAAWFFIKTLLLGQGLDAAMAAFWRFVSKDLI